MNALDTPLDFITTPEGLTEMLQAITPLEAVAVDTESDSLYSYHEKVCLLQFSTPARDYVLDPLVIRDLAALGAFFADPRVEKVFHAAEYDILCLKRDYQFSFASIFDTMLAARILGWKQVGLGAILEERFGVRLNKKFQRADWGQRPLTEEQLAYAREDTHYLLELHQRQLAELERLGRLAEAREEFARLTRVAHRARAFDPDGYLSLKGARDLDPIGLGILRELFHFRESRARAADKPPFKILSNATLLHIAIAHPRTMGELAHVPGMTGWVMRHHARGILTAIERGRANPQRQMPKPRPRNDQPMLDEAARQRLARLKQWRQTRAAARGVEPDVIVSNDILTAAARHNPRTVEALVQMTELGEWKAREYGEDIIRVLQGRR